jgi:carbonic anhydrase/acetyltransferase-like protein (isoleucine patch superfamily)
MAIVRGYGGKVPILGDGVFLAESAALIGDVVVGARSSIWYGAVVRADAMPIRIGADVSIQDNSVLHITSERFGTTVGDRVTVGHRVILHGCTIGDACIIGMGCIVMDGATIGTHCIVGAGALVTPGTDIPEGHLVVGAPARIKRRLTDEELASIEYSAAHYVELGAAYLAAVS